MRSTKNGWRVSRELIAIHTERHQAVTRQLLRRTTEPDSRHRRSQYDPQGFHCSRHFSPKAKGRERLPLGHEVTAGQLVCLQHSGDYDGTRLDGGAVYSEWRITGAVF